MLICILSAIIIYYCRLTARVIEEMQIMIALSQMHDILSMQRVVGNDIVHRLPDAQAIMIVGEVHCSIRLVHLLQLTAIFPDIRPSAVTRWITDSIVRDRCTVIGDQLTANDIAT